MSRKKELTEKQFMKKVEQLIKRHGRVRIVSQDADYQEPCNCMCKSCKEQFRQDMDQGTPDQRRRLIDKNGVCQVSYKSDGHTRWSGFTTSCFMDNYYDYRECTGDCNQNDGINCYCEPKKTVKQTLEFMLDHDRDDLKPIMIEYGPRFKMKVKL